MNCPKCNHEFPNPLSSEGGKKSRRKISKEQQEKMQKARAVKRFDKLPDGEYGQGSPELDIAMKAFCPIVSEGGCIVGVFKTGEEVGFSVSVAVPDGIVSCTVNEDAGQSEEER